MPQHSTAYEILAAAQTAMGNADALAAITSVTALAQCMGPRGAYTTDIYSMRGNRLMFRQAFPDRPGFTAVINGAQAWARDEATGEIERLDTASVEGVRSHEFQMIALTLPERFADAILAEPTLFAGKMCQVVRLMGQLGHSYHAYFAVDDGLWAGMRLPDSRASESDSVCVVINSWRTVGDVLLPARVTATDPAGDFVLDFHTITLNNVDETLFAVPPALAMGDTTPL